MLADKDSDVTGVFVDDSEWCPLSSGLASSLETLLDTFTSSTGIFDSRISIDAQLTEIASDRADFTRLMDSLEDRYKNNLMR